MDCVLDIYTGKIPANNCSSCWQYFDEAILKYVRDHQDEAPLFIGVSLKYTPWNNILKDIIRGEYKGQRLFDAINRCIGTAFNWRL